MLQLRVGNQSKSVWHVLENDKQQCNLVFIGFKVNDTRNTWTHAKQSSVYSAVQKFSALKVKWGSFKKWVKNQYLVWAALPFNTDAVLISTPVHSFSGTRQVGHSCILEKSPQLFFCRFWRLSCFCPYRLTPWCWDQGCVGAKPSAAGLLVLLVQYTVSTSSDHFNQREDFPYLTFSLIFEYLWNIG